MTEKTLTIGLLGYGKMGKLIHQLAKEMNHTVNMTVDSRQCFDIDTFAESDVIIDFSHPSAALENIKKACLFKKNIVMGTTGWYHQTEDVKKWVKESNIGFLYSPNFSIGVQLFFKMVKHAAQLMDAFDEYDICGQEFHHKHKADIPSGTAETLGNILLSQMTRKKKVIYGNDPYSSNDSIHFPSVRCGSYPGTHSIQFDSAIDTITLTHIARNRESFAKGAIQAAAWLHGKKGFFTLEELISEINNGQ